MPQLIDFYEEFAARREKFEILAFHRANKSSFEDLDPDLVSCKERYWKGRDLPFPILLGKQGLSSEKVRVRLSALKAIETIEEPHQMLGHNLSRALEREENKRVKKAIQKVLEDLAKGAPK